MEEITLRNIYEILRNRFKMNELKEGQLSALECLIKHDRVLCIQPTGYGKSLLYQLPSLLYDGITLVVCPLLALMRDQLRQLKNRFEIEAASINSEQSERENFLAKKRAIQGAIRLLFISPEQLNDLEKFNFLLNLSIKFLVIDEAHCISTWGHDFRPTYRMIINLVNALENKNQGIKLLALTATANKKTEKDIKKQLKPASQKKIQVLRESMNRPNLKLTVIHTKNIGSKLNILCQLTKNLKGSGLVYCATRENAETTATYLTNNNINAIAYHAGMSIEKKTLIQEYFMSDIYPIVCATNSLGMGIDKSNLRYVIHFDFPGSLTAYYQEVGRAGRDGIPADGILLYDPANRKIHQFFINNSQPSLTEFQIVLNVFNQVKEPNLLILKKLSNLLPTKLNIILTELIEQNFIQKIIKNNYQVFIKLKKKGLPNLSSYQSLLKFKIQELNEMQKYAEQSRECLMVILRRSLGEIQTEKCLQCSVCINKKNHTYLL